MQEFPIMILIHQNSGLKSERRGTTSGFNWAKYVMAHIKNTMATVRIPVLLQTVWSCLGAENHIATDRATAINKPTNGTQRDIVIWYIWSRYGCVDGLCCECWYWSYNNSNKSYMLVLIALLYFVQPAKSKSKMRSSRTSRTFLKLSLSGSFG